ncbi:MAG: hypothetical protein NT011_00980 [Kiritimatiellaeota bacterium]|nr:hypothetical protein [Kiritimatiellota bacterium]
MTRRERLMATLRGERVDRLPVSFYEIDGSQNTQDPDPFNIYSHPSWHPLIELARDKSDCIVRRGVPFKNTPPDPLAALTKTETVLDAQGSRLTTTTIRAGRRTLTCRQQRDRDIDTVWTIEHLFKDTDDLKAWLDLPEATLGGTPDVDIILNIEKEVGDAGIAMVDTSDPLGSAALLFDMAQFTVVAMTEPTLFHRLLERFARRIHWQTEAIAKALPGRLWRICGPELASPPYLPPSLFQEYVVPYDKPMVAAIQKYGGFARIHSHGRLKDILHHIAATGCVGLDPIEPPPQGDVELSFVREKVGSQMVLFGNLEASDIENLPTPQFEKKIMTAIREGTTGPGRGFVLMPSACPYGRVLSPLALANYRKMVEVVEGG